MVYPLFYLSLLIVKKHLTVGVQRKVFDNRRISYLVKFEPVKFDKKLNLGTRMVFSPPIFCSICKACYNF